jgi:hypothetical protein
MLKYLAQRLEIDRLLHGFTDVQVERPSELNHLAAYVGGNSRSEENSFITPPDAPELSAMRTNNYAFRVLPQSNREYGDH